MQVSNQRLNKFGANEGIEGQLFHSDCSHYITCVLHPIDSYKTYGRSTCIIIMQLQSPKVREKVRERESERERA